MAYEFSCEETIAAGVVRCAGDQLDRAIQALGQEISEDRVEAIHSARKAIKKERALLRLARGSLPADQRAEANKKLRDVARTLSGLRDADVMLQTVEHLADRFSGQLPARMLSAMRDHLVASQASARSEVEITGAAGNAIAELAALRTALVGWNIRGEGWDVIQGGLRRSYGQGRKAFGEACAAPSVVHLHEWRKQVKDHWYHLRLLTGVCGPIVGGAAQSADRLSDLLGEDHDLAVLGEALEGARPDPSVDVEYLAGLIDRRRSELQSEAFTLGARLFAEKPARFERRLRTYWKAGRMSSNLRTRSE